MVRQSVKPVLVVNRAFKPIERALIAFDGGQSARKAVAFVGTSPLFADVEVHLVMVGSGTDKDRNAIGWAKEVLDDRCTRAEVIGGDVEGALKADVERVDADLIIMGAYGHSPLRSMIVGSTTTAMITRLTLPVLLFR